MREYPGNMYVPDNPAPTPRTIIPLSDGTGYVVPLTDCGSASPLTYHEHVIVDLAGQLAAKDAEIAHIKSKADECWGAANYRLKYLACLFRALGRPDDETIESNVSAAAEQIRELITRAEKAEAELAGERRYVQIEHVDSWAKIQDALPPHKEGDDRPLVQVVLDALAELAETKKRNAELQMAVDLAVDHTAERDQLRAEVERLNVELREAIERVKVEQSCVSKEAFKVKELRAAIDAARKTQP